MNRARISTLIAGLSLVSAATLQAQEHVSVTLTGATAPSAGQVTAFGYYMSPYTGTVDGVTGVRINCVDFFHDVSLGENWTATNVNIGDAILHPELLQFTREGSNGEYENTVTHVVDYASVLKVYEEAAWLTSQQPSNPGSDPVVATAIQTAIWAVVDNLPATGLDQGVAHVYETAVPADVESSFTVNTGVTSTAYWIQKAATQYALQTDTFYDSFNILTDINHHDDGSVFSGGDTSAQEFIYQSPEPASLALVGTGLIGLVGFARKRRQQKA